MRANAGASSSQASRIRRQISALRVVEKKRGCTTDKAAAGGLFNACRGLAQRRAKAEQLLAVASNGGTKNARLRARYKQLGCGVKRRSAKKERTAKKERIAKRTKPRRTGPKYAGNALYYCVRPSDGYLFPAPHSQFAKKGDTKTYIDQCRFICDDDSMRLYVLEDPELETEEMLSVETGNPYSELPTAFRYQDDGNLGRCDWNRYFAHVDALRARTVTPRDLSNAIIPLPRFRPEPSPEVVSSIDATEPVSQKVRVVGPVFLPAEEIETQTVSQIQTEQEEVEPQPPVESRLQ
ncbi:DUF2865 domain-containing protein [uncultured Nitratireductor sp.]|uniref:DUF2865 domain-containing protein n=1 Tax=uncultured Nitratireductor sp. TaxID=520953 RepID=UPI0025E777D8|nr:DUF2865 domain-containing protein [uncultured Nitratireductor sp.]